MIPIPTEFAWRDTGDGRPSGWHRSPQEAGALLDRADVHTAPCRRWHSPGLGAMAARFASTCATGWLLIAAVSSAWAANMQPLERIAIDRTEVTIGQFRAFVRATGTVTQAERAGGGQTFEAGWEQRPGWTWQAPFGTPGADDEPAVHITHPEAQAYCRWAGKRLPTDAEWGDAAYREQRAHPPAPFVRGQRYPYPTGSSPRGANCLGDCGPVQAVPHARTSRGQGHARVGSTVAGVNGLFDMGGNVWEWVDSGPDPKQRTRGGSWWYGSGPMSDEHRATKPASTAVVYIGFRCVRDS